MTSANRLQKIYQIQLKVDEKKKYHGFCYELFNIQYYTFLYKWCLAVIQRRNLIG